MKNILRLTPLAMVLGLAACKPADPETLGGFNTQRQSQFEPEVCTRVTKEEDDVAYSLDAFSKADDFYTHLQATHPAEDEDVLAIKALIQDFENYSEQFTYYYSICSDDEITAKSCNNGEPMVVSLDDGVTSSATVSFNTGEMVVQVNQEINNEAVEYFYRYDTTNNGQNGSFSYLKETSSIRIDWNRASDPDSALMMETLTWLDTEGFNKSATMIEKANCSGSIVYSQLPDPDDEESGVELEMTFGEAAASGSYQRCTGNESGDLCFTGAWGE